MFQSQVVLTNLPCTDKVHGSAKDGKNKGIVLENLLLECQSIAKKLVDVKVNLESSKN